MAERMTKLRFTGKRTGLESIAVPRHGVISRGSQVEVDEDTAERWMAVVDADGNSDWAPASGEAPQAEPQPEKAEAETKEAPSEKK